MEEKKKEFDALVASLPQMKLLINGEMYHILTLGVEGDKSDVNNLRNWIEKEINYARMEQDIINNQAFLDKQDKIIQQAKIEENERWLHAFSGYDEESNEPNWATKQRFKKRISELKGE